MLYRSYEGFLSGRNTSEAGTPLPRLGTRRRKRKMEDEESDPIRWPTVNSRGSTVEDRSHPPHAGGDHLAREGRLAERQLSLDAYSVLGSYGWLTLFCFGASRSSFSDGAHRRKPSRPRGTSRPGVLKPALNSLETPGNARTPTKNRSRTNH